MKSKNYSVHIHFDKRYPKVGTELFPVQLAMNINGLQFKMSLRLYATEPDYNKALNSKGGSEEVKELRKQINEYVRKAESILERLPNPTREIFQRMFKSESDLHIANKTEVTFLFQQYIDRVNSEDRIKTAQMLTWSLKSFKKYKPTINFEDINEAWLNGYKAFMLKQGSSTTTVQLYMRNLRAVFNVAIREGYISQKHYPFSTYTIGTSAKSKSVLYAADIKKVWYYEGTTLREKRARAYWMFCYLGSGMNFKDCCYLKFKNIKGDTLSFVREKTKNTNTVADKQITVYLHDEMRLIIETWGNKPGNPDDYIFPILNGKKTTLEKEVRRKKMQREINDKLKVIGKKLGIEEKLILNIARHSMATQLKIAGTPTSHIGDAMGHSSSRTTESYLKSLPTEMARELSNKLLNFNDQ